MGWKLSPVTDHDASVKQMFTNPIAPWDQDQAWRPNLDALPKNYSGSLYLHALNTSMLQWKTFQESSSSMRSKPSLKARLSRSFHMVKAKPCSWLQCFSEKVLRNSVAPWDQNQAWKPDLNALLKNISGSRYFHGLKTKPGHWPRCFSQTNVHESNSSMRSRPSLKAQLGCFAKKPFRKSVLARVKNKDASAKKFSGIQ